MSPRYGYLQARIQSRYAQLPNAGLWLHLGALKALASYLEEARGTQLVVWITGLSAYSTAEDIERHLHQRFVDTIAETASWFDQNWRPAILWLETFTELATLDHLRLNNLSTEHKVSELLLENLGYPANDIHDLPQVWVDKWRSLWPAESRQNLNGVNLLQKLLQHHWRAFSSLPVREAWKAREELENRLRFLFRRHLLQPAAALAYLALLAISLERLRSELMQRALFPVHEEALS